MLAVKAEVRSGMGLYVVLCFAVVCRKQMLRPADAPSKESLSKCLEKFIISVINCE
jgi:hypothetical protein